MLAGLSLFFLPVHAQFIPGIKGGVSFGTLSGFSGDSRVSGHAGFFLHHTINNHWCFQPELLYSGEGQRYVSDGVERTIKLGYIEVPLMIQYYALQQLYFEFGPQFGVLVSAGNKPTGGNEINVKSDFRSTQFGLNIGAGVNVNKSLGFYGRYDFGLTDVSLFDNIVDHSQVAQVGMTIRLK